MTLHTEPVSNLSIHYFHSTDNYLRVVQLKMQRWPAPLSTLQTAISNSTATRDALWLIPILPRTERLLLRPEEVSTLRNFQKMAFRKKRLYSQEFITTYSDDRRIWFFNRSSIPSSLQGNVSSFDTKTLGEPVSNYPSTGCDIDTFFKPQQLVFDITLCGDLYVKRPIF